MPVAISGETYYRTQEACRMIGVSRSTLLRWIRDGVLRDVSHRDRRGWRLFSEGDINAIKAEASRLT
jgi:excisionase family DNA binding protein